MIYHGNAGTLNDIADAVGVATEHLKRHLERFDFVLVTGMSGVLVGSPVAINLGKPLVVLRKQFDNSHQFGDIINRCVIQPDSRYLFLDDFISMGQTYHRVRVRMEKFGSSYGDKPDCVTRYAGAYLYQDDALCWDGDGTITYRPHDKFAPAIFNAKPRRAAA